MSQKNLPPLEVDTRYRVQAFEGFGFSSQPHNRGLTGEDTAILLLKLSNATILEIPAAEAQLGYLLTTLMEAYPVKALDHLRQRWPAEFAPKT